MLLAQSDDINKPSDEDDDLVDQSSLKSFYPVDDSRHKIHVYKPLKYAVEPASRCASPILFLFHPDGNSMRLLTRMKPIADELGWLIVGVDAYRNTKSLRDQYRSRMNGTKAAAVISFGGWLGNMHNKSYAKKMLVAQVNGNDDRGALAYEKKDARYLSEQRRAHVKAFRFTGGHVIAPEKITLQATRWIHSEKNF